MRLPASLTVLAALAACAAPDSGPVLEQGAPRIVIAQASGVNFLPALSMAEGECAPFGLHAEYVPDNVADDRATFICVPFISGAPVTVPEGLL